MSKRLVLYYIIFASLLITSNCIAAKQLYIGKWFGQNISITAGILCYPGTFLITDVIGENYGKKAANRAIILGLIAQVIAICLITIANLIPGDNESLNISFNSVLGSNWILTIGSLVACLISQTWDVFIFHKIRNIVFYKDGNSKRKWIWNNVSTISSQLIDSIVFYIFLIIMLRTQGIILPLNTIVVTIFVYWIIKIVIALLDTPVFYLLTRRKDYGR